MPKPPQSPPSSDIDGVNKDGTRPSKTLPVHGQDGGDLERAERESAGRPDRGSEDSGDDRTS